MTTRGPSFYPRNSQIDGVPVNGTSIHDLRDEKTAANATPDSSPNKREGYPLGTVLPSIVTSPTAGFGNAMRFDGVNRAGNSSVVLVGVLPYTANTPWNIECRFQRERNTVLEILAGENTLNAATARLLYLDATSGGRLVGAATTDSGGLISLTAPCSLGTHTAALDYDGAMLRLFLDGVLITQAAMGTRAQLNPSRFMIGAQDDSTNPYPIQGVIDEVRVSSISRYTTSYTPATVPHISDSSTVGLWHLDTISTTGYTPIVVLTSPLLAGNAGVSAADKTFQISPSTVGSTNLSATVVTVVSPPTNKGWQIPYLTDMGSVATVQRVIRAGQTLTGRMRGTQQNTVAGVLTISFNYYKRAQDGTYVSIKNSASTVPGAIPASSPWNGIVVSTALASDVVFAPGETLYVEMFLTIPGQTATSCNVIVNLDNTVGWSLPSSNDIIFRHLKAISDSLPMSDSVDILAKKNRVTSDAAPMTDSISRTTTLSRSTFDVMPSADLVSRVLLSKRSMSDTASATDQVSRVYKANRATSDTASTSDIVTRSLTQARSTFDSAPAVDNVTRRTTYNRKTEDNIGSTGGVVAPVKQSITYVFDD